MTVFINPYKRGSHSANALKRALRERGIKTIIRNREPIFASPTIVFWGQYEPEYDLNRFKNIVNHPASLPFMTNKLRFFRHCGDSPYLPQWTTDPQEAASWEGRVVCRHELAGHSGAGIELWEASQDRPIPFAPLYVRYEKKTHEFRLHMARKNGVFEPILVQRKIAKKGVAKDFTVRNHANGFIFVQESDFPAPQSVLHAGKVFMQDCFPELHFAALDVIYHHPTQREFILEGNTAPGLEGNTVNVYADYIASIAR